MAYRTELRPKYGFTILSNGEILRGERGSYCEDDVAKYYAQWIMMKAAGFFPEKEDDTMAVESTQGAKDTKCDNGATTNQQSLQDGLDTMD